MYCVSVSVTRLKPGVNETATPSAMIVLLSSECHIICRVEIDAIIHDAEEGGYWAEVPAIPGCSTQGETLEELITNLQEAIDGCLSALPGFDSVTQ
jgi:predicted RNase H-like HicB family nuclease